ncbi:MAG: hypothetical protein H7146_12160 [Burkholderiaceae bacterium]|nr:hypothetical protein [Microbacteriaceae bacterium]
MTDRRTPSLIPGSADYHPPERDEAEFIENDRELLGDVLSGGCRNSPTSWLAGWLAGWLPHDPQTPAAADDRDLRVLRVPHPSGARRTPRVTGVMNRGGVPYPVIASRPAIDMDKERHRAKNADDK